MLLGAFVAAEGGTGWAAEWVAADAAYGIVAGVLLGAAGGRAIAAGTIWLRRRDLLLPVLDGWVAVGSVLLVYGAAELAGGYGFLAAFAAGLAFRRNERESELNRRVHDGAEIVEKFAELALILLLGSTLTLSGLQAPGVEGWLLVPFLLVLVRPALTVLAFARSPTTMRERLFIGWFGVRGVGSVYYGSVALGLGVLSDADERLVVWTGAACVLSSILVHGVSATPLSRRLGTPGAAD